MDSRTAGAPALGAAKPPAGLPLLSTREAPPSPGAAFAPAGHSGQERETEKAADKKKKKNQRQTSYLMINYYNFYRRSGLRQ
uniref:Uncharacterized protein n=1 Tax=Balaenoptera musculus TaxID=9771 RepID=A0A8C0HX84_BALMU